MNQKPVESALGDELDSAGADVADRLCGLDRGFTHGRAQGRRHAGRRRLLDHLLVPALQRAVALIEMDGAAMRVGEHLDLDVAGARNEFLDQDAALAEGGGRLALRARERSTKLGALIDAAHAFAAAARHRLDQYRIADRVRLAGKKPFVLPIAMIPRHDRHAGLLHQRLRAVLQSHGADGARRRTDEYDPGRVAGLREVRILGQEPIAGMDALRPAWHAQRSINLSMAR